jgi:DNA-binding PadR family transcriptional regulator
MMHPASDGPDRPRRGVRDARDAARASRQLRSPARRTLWSLAVLALLREAPIHPYEMQRQMHLRHTDELLALKRGSIYHAIFQLQRDGLIEPVEVSREGRRPERTVYRITPDGDEELVNWLRELLAMPVREPSQFTAALAHIQQLDTSDALEQLTMRAVSIEIGIAAMAAVERSIGGLVGRASVLEVEYVRILMEAERTWLTRVIDDLKTQRLNWNVDIVHSKIENHDINVDNYEHS